MSFLTIIPAPFEAKEGEEYCSFHLPVEKKDPDEFWKNLANYLIVLMEVSEDEKVKGFFNWREAWIFIERDEDLLNYYKSEVKKGEIWKFIGFKFPEMDGNHNFRELVFDKANFIWAEFSESADFWEVEFFREAYFIGAKFLERQILVRRCF